MISSTELDSADASVAFAALGSEARLAIMRALVRAGPDGLPVGKLQERVGIAASTLSHHLRALVAASLIEQVRDGRSLRCCADYARVEALAAFLISECCVDPETPGASKENAR